MGGYFMPGSSFPEGHHRLMAYVKALGYQFDDTGICFGLAHMGMQALLSKEMNEFDERLNTLMKIDRSQIAAKIEAARLKHANLMTNSDGKASALTKEQLSLLEIPAFVEGLLLYFQPDRYPAWFEKNAIPEGQNAMLSAPLVMSEEIEKQGGLNELMNFSGIYSEKDLAHYFASLKEEINNAKPPITEPFSLSLSNSKHNITVGYDGHNWVYIDANHMPSQYITDEKKIANKVHRAFAGNKKRDVALSTKLYVTKKNSNALAPVLGAWKNNTQFQAIHSLTAENVGRVDSTNTDWLSIAAIDGNIEEVSALLAIESIKDNQINAALSRAAAYGHNDVVKLLLKQDGININSRENVPLLRAAASNHSKIIEEFLIEPSVEINIQNSSGLTALFAAAKNGCLDALNLLLDNKAEIDLANNNDETPLWIASENGHCEIVNALIAKNADPNLTDIKHRSPLYVACSNGHLDVVKALLAVEGVDPNKREKAGMTFPLFVAAEKGNFEIVNALLAAKRINPNQADSEGVTALYIAVQNRNYEVVKRLLKVPGIEVNTGDFDDMTPLHVAAQNGDLEMVRLLLAAKDIAPNNRDLDNLTPLYIAAAYNHKDIVKELLKAGVDPQRALDKATEKGNTAAISLIENVQQELAPKRSIKNKR